MTKLQTFLILSKPFNIKILQTHAWFKKKYTIDKHIESKKESFKEVLRGHTRENYYSITQSTSRRTG